MRSRSAGALLRPITRPRARLGGNARAGVPAKQHTSARDDAETGPEKEENTMKSIDIQTQPLRHARWQMALLGAWLIAAAACSSDSTDPHTPTPTPEPEGPGNIVEVAEGAGFNALLAAATRAGLAETLATGGPFTVFAPTDEAFAALLSSIGATSVDDVPEATLAAILQYHVVSGTVRQAQIPASANSISELTLLFDTSAGVRVNDATVTQADVPASNGIIHVIDKVLALPDLIDIAGFAGLTTLATALTEADLVSTLRGEGPFTVFAPTNAAFAALPALPEGDALELTLQYHVVSGARVAAGDIASGLSTASAVATDSNANALTLILNKDESVNVNAATVMQADIRATNGIIHIIGSVLLPPTIVDLAGFAGLTSLASALGAADGDLVATLSTPGTFTVLAPTNAAFAAITAPTDPSELANLLLYHVLGAPNDAAPVLASGVPNNATLPTLFADNNITSNTESGVTFTDAQGGVANVVIPDVVGTNGVVHVINRVLQPASL